MFVVGSNENYFKTKSDKMENMEFDKLLNQ